MDKFNFNGGENILKSICWILSYLSWLLVAVNNLASLRCMYKVQPNQIWNIHIYALFTENLDKLSVSSNIDFESSETIGYIPIQMDQIMVYIVYNIWIILSIIGCVVFIIKTLFKKEQTVIDGMMGKFSQFHFFPLICAFILSVLGEIIDDENSYDVTNAGLTFALFGAISMVLIYIMTDFTTIDWWAEYSLKKGTFSCLIILFWYNFCYSIFWVRFVADPIKADQKFVKGCGMAFSLLFGMGSLAFSVAFKDIIICFMNILIYFGMAKFYFDLPIMYRSTKYFNENGDGAMDLLILICSIIWFLNLIIEMVKNEINKLSQQILGIGQVQTLSIAKINYNTEQINLLSHNMNSATTTKSPEEPDKK